MAATLQAAESRLQALQNRLERVAADGQAARAEVHRLRDAETSATLAGEGHVVTLAQMREAMQQATSEAAR